MRLCKSSHMQQTTSTKTHGAEQPILKWNASKQDLMLVSKIARRAGEIAWEFEIPFDHMNTMMDIEACHNNGNPLDLAALFAADDANLAHDVFGIQRHINRSTGKLENCFVPRFTVSKEIAQTLSEI